MGKKAVNEKALSAKEKKASAKAEQQTRQEKEAEDSYWKEAGEGSKSKAAAKKEEAEKKKQEAAAKKLEAKKLAEAEEAALSKASTSKAKAGAAKVTQFQLQKQKEYDARVREQEQRERELAVRREVAEDHYAAVVETENINRQTDVLVATGLDDALAVLTVAEDAADKHPEKRMKAAWSAYQERMLPVVREDKPNLKMSQYKDMIWKLWQKAPENPLNQPPTASK